MIAVFLSSSSKLSVEINKSLPELEASSLILVDFESLPIFTIRISDEYSRVLIQVGNKEYLIDECITLAFPSFKSSGDFSKKEYFISSWEASFLAIQEVLHPHAIPNVAVSSWIESFEISYASRPSVANLLNVRFAESYIQAGEYQPKGKEIIYDLEKKMMLFEAGDYLVGYHEIFPSMHTDDIYSATVFRNECWISRILHGEFTPYYLGNISELQNSNLSSMFSKAADRWKLVNLLYIKRNNEIALVQARFDVANTLHESHYPSFVNAITNYATARYEPNFKK